MYILYNRLITALNGKKARLYRILYCQNDDLEFMGASANVNQ